MISSVISLLPQEAKLISLLLDTCKNIPTPVQLRFAGGWVRDKLLGLVSDDIDIAIDTMTGESFANYLKKTMESRGLAMSCISTIQLNPEKSKHLETATARVMGYEVDFVNLRTETYNSISRNPQIAFGTPLEDALRRDITINTLFYNLHTREVEDFSGYGINDLRNATIRTPLPPHQTFLDDPLRVLRTIRFCTRFNFKLVPEILESAKSPEIQDMFMRKISRERVGVEIEKMLCGNDPQRATQLIQEIGYHHLVFSPPQNMIGHPNLDEAVIAIRMLTLLRNDFGVINIKEFQQKFLYLACCVIPYRDALYTQKKKELPVFRHVILSSLKLSNLDADMVTVLLSHSGEISKLVQINAGAQGQISRRAIGLLIRKIGIRPLCENFKYAIMMAFIVECLSLSDSLPTSARLIFQKYQLFLETITKLDLESAFILRPLLDGKEISAHLGIKAGPIVGRMIEALVEWQLEFPEMRKADAYMWLDQRR